MIRNCPSSSRQRVQLIKFDSSRCHSILFYPVNLTRPNFYRNWMEETKNRKESKREKIILFLKKNLKRIENQEKIILL